MLVVGVCFNPDGEKSVVDVTDVYFPENDLHLEESVGPDLSLHVHVHR